MGIAKNNSYMRAHFNNSRISKDVQSFQHLRTSDFVYWNKKAKKYDIRKVKTELQPQVSKDYEHLIDFFKDIKDREYTCAGLNSFEREVLIIDCDDTDYGESTRKLLEENGIQWDYQKIKNTNGHSQTGIFLSEKVYLYDCQWNYGAHCYIENHHEQVHEMYKRVYNYLNFIANGDLMYTGYNCQNPMFESKNTHTVWNEGVEHHTLAWWDTKLSKIVSEEKFLEAHKAAYASKKKPVRKRVDEALEEIERTVVKRDDETDEAFAQRKREETAKALILAEKTGDKSINYAILQEVQRSLKYCLDNHTPFTYEMAIRHALYMYDESIRKVGYYESIGDYEKAKAIDMFAGYQREEVKSRARSDYWQLVEGRLKKTDLSKIGYNIIQRDLAQTVAMTKKLIKHFRLAKLLEDNKDISERDLAKLYVSTYKEPMSKTTVRNCLTMTLPEYMAEPNRWQPLLCYNEPLTRKYYELENALVDARNAYQHGHLEHVEQFFVPLYQDGNWFMHDPDEDNIKTIPYEETWKAQQAKKFAAAKQRFVDGEEIAVGVVLSEDFCPQQQQLQLIQSFSSSDSIQHTYILTSFYNQHDFTIYNNGLTSFKAQFHYRE